jgi:hypothetical protein
LIIFPSTILACFGGRVHTSHIARLKTEADRLGIPYQTFIGSILHRYAKGELLDRKSAQPNPWSSSMVSLPGFLDTTVRFFSLAEIPSVRVESLATS